MFNKIKGNWGEDKAAEYLSSRGYKILERQFRTSIGEVDIITVCEDTLVLVEVKNWDKSLRDSLGLSVNERKKDRIRRVAEVYLEMNPVFKEYFLRFDLIFLSGRMGELEHFENAF